MGATMEVLQVQWGRAMLDGDFQAVERIDAARRHIEALPARRKVEALPVRKAEALPAQKCVWAGSDECRLCPLSDSCAVCGGVA